MNFKKPLAALSVLTATAALAFGLHKEMQRETRHAAAMDKKEDIAVRAEISRLGLVTLREQTSPFQLAGRHSYVVKQKGQENAPEFNVKGLAWELPPTIAKITLDKDGMPCAQPLNYEAKGFDGKSRLVNGCDRWFF